MNTLAHAYAADIAQSAAHDTQTAQAQHDLLATQQDQQQTHTPFDFANATEAPQYRDMLPLYLLAMVGSY